MRGISLRPFAEETFAAAAAASISARRTIGLDLLMTVCSPKNSAQNAEGRRALAQYVEPRYLHQTMAKSTTGRILRAVDLTEELALHPEADFQDAEMWRIHFHVPVNAEQLGPLKTTRSELKQALNTVAELDYAPHLEVETYTWEILPDGNATNLIDGLTRELQATQSLLESL